MERALTQARQEHATQRRTVGKPSADDDIPAKERVRILHKLFDRYYGEVTEEGTFLFPHVVDVLNALQAKGLPLGLVTNKPMPPVMPLLEALDIVKYFSMVIGGDDVQNKKPYSNPLLLMTEQMGIAPQQMLFIGDSRSGIQAAKMADYPSVGLTYGYNYGETIDLSQPNVVYQSINDLLPVLGPLHSGDRESKND